MDNQMMNTESYQVASTTDKMMISRQAQEVQAAMVIAKRFPRDEIAAINRIKNACKRKGLAEQAEYEYPRGNTKITGPSIRLAESIAQNWGNVDYGIIELENDNDKSQMMAYAWDLETNTRVTKIFSVEHVRNTKKGSYKLTDSRDIYEATANFGSRRVRACILGIIPGDVVDEAVETCHKTLVGQYKEPLKDRLIKMFDAFEDNYSVNKEMIEKYIGYKAESFDEKDFLKLRRVYKGLDDGMAKREDYFELKLPNTEETSVYDQEGETDGTNEG